jgi:hypothetical protein
MERTWKPTTAGILSIIAGALSCSFLSFIYFGIGTLTPNTFEVALGAAIGAPLIILGIIPIIGGIFSLKRRLWGLALAGAICALFPLTLIFGILAIIFLVMGKNEFD